MCRGMRHWEQSLACQGCWSSAVGRATGQGTLQRGLETESQQSEITEQPFWVIVLRNLFGSLSSSLGMGSPGEERKSCPGNSHHPCTHKGFTGMAQTAALLCPCTSQPKVGSACFAPDLPSSEQSPWRRERRGDTGFVPSTSCR